MIKYLADEKSDANSHIYPGIASVPARYNIIKIAATFAISADLAPGMSHIWLCALQ